MTVVEETKPETSEGTKIWSSILQEVRLTTQKKLLSNKSIIVLGDNEAGKTSLIAKMAGLETPRKGSGLEYNFFEVRDEYRDDSTKLGAWILDGDLKHVDLLNFALTEENFDNSICLLVASMSQPWNIMKSLEIWANVLEQHIEKLKMKPTKLKQCQQRLLFKFLNYVSSNDEAEGKLVAGINKLADQSSSSRGVSINEDDFDATIASELEKNTLSKNLGIEVVVVITKTDYISVLEKEYDYTEETFDFIQQAIRKFCLQYGASLFYVSAKANKNFDLLHKYLAHRLYDLPFKAVASVVEKDAIFVPAGWDNEKKISILYDNIKSANPDDDFNDFILERVHPGQAQRDIIESVEEDQAFLLRLQSELGKTIGSAPSPVQQRQNLINPTTAEQQPGETLLSNFFNTLLARGNV